MNTAAAPAPSIAYPARQTAASRIEAVLEAEREQLPLWLPVALGSGIAAWFLLPGRATWLAMLALCGAVALAALASGRGGRAGWAVALFAGMAAAGLALVWTRAERVAAPVLARPAIVTLSGRIEAVERMPAKGKARLLVAPSGCMDRDGACTLPPRIRLSVDEAGMPAGIVRGARIAARARLVPPPPAAVPGAYDFARIAWFRGIGATGRALGPVRLVAPAVPDWRARLAGLRARLSAHIQARLPGTGGGVAAALATGDTGAIPEDDQEAMRRSGLAHLLSVSGLHLTAVVAATMILTLQLLALWPALALRAPLTLIAAAVAALAGIGYTLLTGAEVPTVRSCIASLLVLLGIALGRDAMTLRLVATGALIVLAVRPEALVGPSFQLSFAAITAIVALHDHPAARRLFAATEEAWPCHLARALGGLIATGVVVELTLMPIALFHFHRSGLYGALANIVAIPLTTFVIMPLEAVALLLDGVGIGRPFWWLTGLAMDLLLWIAHAVADTAGAVTMLPSMPFAAFALMAGGGIWIALWRTRLRWWGALPFAAGALWAATARPPDLLVTGDGRHLALRTGDGIALLRPRAGDYVRDTLGELSGTDAEAGDLGLTAGARCNADLCSVRLTRGGRTWRLTATRSRYAVAWPALTAACRRSDIIVSDRRLPRACTPRWLKADAALLRRTGGLAIDLTRGRAVTVMATGDDHPWAIAARPER